jgi:hypothetical protein
MANDQSLQSLDGLLASPGTQRVSWKERMVPLVHRLFRSLPASVVHRLIAYDLMPRPQYAYGVYQAACLAQSLGVRKFCSVEFGVAGGRGLIRLEHIAETVGRVFNIDISVVGFDAGTGLPNALDYKDHPYLWQQGFYAMEPEKLKRQLRRADLVIGDVKETVAEYGRRLPAPVGFISFDLDYYTSTMDAFRVFDYPASSRLPRIFCYFDDVCAPDFAAYHEFAGELLAIRHFNQTHESMKLGKMQALPLQRRFPAIWNEAMYVLHDFEHPDYNRNVLPDRWKQMPI